MGQLKPFWWIILIIFILLFGQGMCDLTLPDYMSRIVNIGIQQNGIADPAPTVIRASEMDRARLFMDDDQRETVEKYYTLLDADSLSGDELADYIKDYPALATTPLYELNDKSSAALEVLSPVFRQPLAVVAVLESQGADSIPGLSLPPGMDIFTFLSGLSEEQLSQVRQMAAEQTAGLPESIVDQSAISYLGTEYRTIGVNVGGMQTNYILRIGGLMLALTLLGTALSITVGFLSSRIAAGFARNTRRKLFKQVETFSNAEFDKFSTASLITRSTNDIQQIQLVLVMLLRMVFYAPILGIGGVVKALGQDVSLSWIIVVAVCALLTLVIIVFVVAVPKFKKVQKMVDHLNLVTREALTGLMVIRAFNTQQHEEKRFDRANIDLTRINLFIQRVMVFMMPVMMLLMNCTMVGIVWFGAHQVDMGSMQVGNMMAFMQYTMQIIMAFLFVSMIFILLPRASVSAQRIAEVIETKPSIHDPDQPLQFPDQIHGSLEFQNVAFKYPGADDYVLKDISFKAAPGQTVAIVGGTGSGKSTVVNLIPRFYDVTEGQILVDETDIRTVRQSDLRDKLGYIPQKTVLFSGTIESNLKYADENADETALKTAAAIAQSADFIEASENGYQTDISQGGMNLSGGQKQRLAIARALVKRPEIYIFDDSFSAVDYKTDAALRKALRTQTDNSTVLIVAQRISTIMGADQIIVLENGRIAGKGTHKELMEKCEVYKELALSQLSREELD
jgi:ATP-binding cassette subfamily B multidrug efflux pump